MDNDTILEVKNITKIYPGVVALDNVSLSFKKGEVHALIGENGAGKSTLIKTLTGAIFPTSGTIEYNGKTYSKMDSHEALELGISAIYQEFNLINHLTVAENIFYGREYSNGILVDFKKMCQLTNELCKEMDVQINPKKKVKDVGVAYQQIIEILKAASKNSNILIMDEPTAPLTTHETESLFKLIKKLKDKGTTIIYISHRLEEIFAVCDRLSVMRDGKFITTVNTADTSRKELVKLMVGRELGNDYPAKNTPDTDEVILELKNICTDKLKNISFALKKGEILGLGGLVGAGRTEVGMAIFGGDAISSGQIIVKGKKVKISNPGEAVKNKIALIPEDRKRHGLILNLEIRKNISFSSLNTISSGSFIKKDKEYKMCESLIKDLTIKTPSMNQFAKNLSGGNQQKVVLAKWLASGADIFIFDEPTRGIDVGAKQEIYKLMRNLTEAGKSIIMISSEMPELMGMSDRILVMYHGEIRAELLKNEYSQENILEIASGS